jgi:hypothetical protein
MDDSKWERYAALGGIWFVVLNVVGAFLPGTPPASDDSAAKIANYFSDHADAIKCATLLLGLGFIGLLWWFGSLYRRMSEAEGGRPRMAVVALAGLALAGSMALVAAAILSTVALRIDDGGVAASAKFFYIMQLVLFAVAGFGIVVHIAAVTSLSWRTKLFASWINVVGWIAALFFLIGTLGVVTDASWLGPFGLIAFLTWCVWIIGVSLSMWRQPAATPAAV